MSVRAAALLRTISPETLLSARRSGHEGLFSNASFVRLVGHGPLRQFPQAFSNVRTCGHTHILPPHGTFRARSGSACSSPSRLCWSRTNSWRPSKFVLYLREYVLGWLPRGTHQWERFITPQDLARYAEAAGLPAPNFEGITYNPLQDVWSRSSDTAVNYLMSATRPANPKQATSSPL